MNLIFVLASLFVFAGTVSAQNCTYGNACQPVDLTVNKMVKHPVNNVFVENIVANGPTYSPGSEVLFRIIVTNSSGETFNPVTVRDVLPEHLTFVSGPGTYNSTTRELVLTLNNLVAGETRTVEILTKVVNVASNAVLFCEHNYVHVSAPARPNGDDDTAQVCVQTTVMGAPTLPVAGYNDLLVALPFAAAGMASIALLKKRG